MLDPHQVLHTFAYPDNLVSGSVLIAKKAREGQNGRKPFKKWLTACMASKIVYRSIVTAL